jgi:hypothetical protein
MRPRMAAIRPSKVLRAVVGGERDDCVVVKALGSELLHHSSNDVVELREPRFRN